MYSQGFREAALRLYDYFKNYKKVADALNIGSGTIWRWKNNGVIPKNTCNIVFTQAMLAFMKVKFEEHNEITLNGMKVEIFNAFSISVSRQCIANARKKLGLTRKRLRYRGTTNKTRLVERHFQFIKQYKKFKEQGVTVMASDEMGFDQTTLPIYGYSPIGTKAILRKIHPTRRSRISIILTIDSEGNDYYELVSGTTNSERYIKYIEKLPWPKGTVLLIDNASIHTSSIIKKGFRKKDYHGLFIPPY
jgi:hypothetical protein